MLFMIQKAGNSLNTNPIIFDATVPTTGDKNLFFLLGSLRVGKIKLIHFAICYKQFDYNIVPVFGTV